jgi:hypothetical protein
MKAIVLLVGFVVVVRRVQELEYGIDNVGLVILERDGSLRSFLEPATASLFEVCGPRADDALVHLPRTGSAVDGEVRVARIGKETKRRLSDEDFLK